MAGFNILPRSKESCHCRTKIGLGARSKVGTERKDILSILPENHVRAIREGAAASAFSEECCPPEQNAEAVIPTVWAMRIAAGKGDIATRWKDEPVDWY